MKLTTKMKMVILTAGTSRRHRHWLIPDMVKPALREQGSKAEERSHSRSSVDRVLPCICLATWVLPWQGHPGVAPNEAISWWGSALGHYRISKWPGGRRTSGGVTRAAPFGSGRCVETVMAVGDTPSTKCSLPGHALRVCTTLWVFRSSAVQWMDSTQLCSRMVRQVLARPTRYWGQRQNRA